MLWYEAFGLGFSHWSVGKEGQIVPIHAFAFLSLLQLFYLQFHAVLLSKTIRISYNEIVRLPS